LGTLWHQAQMVRYSAVSETVSSLSALSVPNRESMTAITILGALGLISIAVTLNHCGFTGRIFLAIAGIGMLGVALFPVPGINANSAPHTFFAAVFLIAMCLWPAAAHFGRDSHLWALTIRQTLKSVIPMALLGICFWFNWLVSTPIMGLVERIFLFSQFGFLTTLIWRSRVILAKLGCQQKCAISTQTQEKIGASV